MSRAPLSSSSVYVRIRPIAEAGAGDGHVDGEPVSKNLKSWTDTDVVVHDGDRGVNTTFSLSKVIGPDLKQEATYDAMLPSLLEGHFWKDVNVMFFAYGQTGSGKTHTILGEVESLSSAEPTEGWGVFPRVVHNTLETMRRWRGDGTHAVLIASAVEFYCGAAFDLNSEFRNQKNEVTIDANANMFGAKTKEVKSVRGLRKWLCRMYANRTTNKTNMNEASSRSHCAFTLTLHKVASDGKYSSTAFSLIDMAGSERCAKTGGERIDMTTAGIEAADMMAKGTPEELSIGAQGSIINGEISMITTEIIKASDLHKRGQPYKASKEMSTAASFYFCLSCDGRAKLGACVTVSQSPQHGFETWFSLKQAEAYASLKAPLKRVGATPLEKALEAAAKEAKETEERFAKGVQNPQGAKQYRVWSMAKGAMEHSKETLGYLQKLAEMRAADAKAPSGESDGESDGPWASPLAPSRVKQVTEAPQKSALEMGKINETFQVFIRIRPLNSREAKDGATNCFEVSDIEDFPRDPPPQRITVLAPGSDAASGSKDEGRSSPPPRESGSDNTFVFNRVFEDGHRQSQVYRDTASLYVKDFLSGTNVTIFAYGQTGSGKTYTIQGPNTDTGIISRCLMDIFAGLPELGKELHYEYFQIYMDSFKDLLVAESSKELKIVEDAKDKSKVHLQNVTCKRAENSQQILRDLELGASRRATRAQDMNEVSSRSHAILVLKLRDAAGQGGGGSSGSQDAPPQKETTMFVVDLAGSERISRSGVTGKGLEEATSINMSLTALGRVVLALIDNQKFIPYNSTPLTSILRGGLGGNSKTALIACVTQAQDSMGESINTLRFGMQASHVKNKVDKNREQQEKAEFALSGNTPELSPDGKGVIPLKSGNLEVSGRWDASANGDKIAILLADQEPEKEYRTMIELLAKSGESGIRVLAPNFGTKKSEVDKDAEVLLSLLDWLGVAKPVLYGRDWGAIRALRFKVLHPTRAACLVLEEYASKVTDPKKYKEMQMKDAMKAYGWGNFVWVWDGAYPSSGDFKGGKNVAGLKGKIILLWPYMDRGKHDPNMRGQNYKSGVAIAKAMGLKPDKMRDTFLMTDEDVAREIVAAGGLK